MYKNYWDVKYIKYNKIKKNYFCLYSTLYICKTNLRGQPLLDKAPFLHVLLL